MNEGQHRESHRLDQPTVPTMRDDSFLSQKNHVFKDQVTVTSNSPRKVHNFDPRSHSVDGPTSVCGHR
jgi:hypothetical protein